jgi:Protein of unknown function (DUF5132)
LSHENLTAPSLISDNGTVLRTSGGKRTPSRKSAYFLGAASGVALALFAPILRPAAKGAVKGGIKIGRQARKIASVVKEEFEDIASEAQAEMNTNEGKPDSEV